MAAPLQVSTVNFQTLPTTTDPVQYTGTKWKLTAGITQTNDLFNLQVTVPPGQFITSNTQTIADWLEEAVGTEAEGTVLGIPISTVRMATAESSTEFYVNFLPLIVR